MKAIVDHCYEARDYSLLNSSVTILSKKHGQLKGAVQAIVEQVMGWLDDVKARDGVERWLELVETLRGVTEGKVRRFISASKDVTLRPCSCRYSWRHQEPV